MKRKIITIFFCSTSFYCLAQDSLPALSIKEYPVLWQQMSGEYRALCYQAYNLAELKLDEAIKKDSQGQKLAIITDLDETVLDNSYMEAYKIINGKDINYADWKKWIDQPVVPTVPGSVDFLQYASQKGVTIFYISNRSMKGMNVTLATLQKLKLPDADTAHILLVTDSYSKEGRRQMVSKDYNVVLLFGDNLNDFMQVFEDKPADQRMAETDSLRKEWGNKFVILPNAWYGDWENALYNYDPALSEQQKEALRRQLLSKGLLK